MAARSRFDSESGILLGGQMIAASGGAGGQGGTLSVNLLTPDYTDINRFVDSFVPDVPAYQKPSGAGGERQCAVTISHAIISNHATGRRVAGCGFRAGETYRRVDIAAGGFDVVSLSSGDAIFDRLGHAAQRTGDHPVDGDPGRNRIRRRRSGQRPLCHLAGHRHFGPVGSDVSACAGAAYPPTGNPLCRPPRRPWR